MPLTGLVLAVAVAPVLVRLMESLPGRQDRIEVEWKQDMDLTPRFEERWAPSEPWPLEIRTEDGWLLLEQDRGLSGGVIVR